jgi:DNA modification methylase
MDFRKINVKKLIPADYNPRKDLKPGDKEYEKIKRSIEEFGYIDPIICNKDMTVVGGHQRLKVLKDLGHTEVECVVVDVDKTREKALNIALNKISGEWDFEALKDLLQEIDTGEIDMELTGFDMSEIENLMSQFHDGDVKEDDFDADKALEEIVEPITRRGDIWQLGRNRLMCGDSTLKKDTEKLLDGNKAHMCFTDPPYNINYGNIKHPKFKQREIQNDNMSKQEFKKFCFEFTSRIKENVLGCVYMAGPPVPEGRIMFTVADELLHCSTTIIWNKDQFTLGRSKYQNKYEPIWFGWVENGSRFSQDRTLVNVWDIKRPKSSDLHPTMKPIELVSKAINDASLSGDIVLDLFGGSGSTLIACEQINRICYMMELDEKYCDVIIKRWETLTGKKAELIKG